MRNIMLDIETLGTQPGSVITEIGAVEFFTDTQRLGSCFYKQINITTSTNKGFVIDPETLKFWFKQPSEAQKHLYSGTGDCLVVIEDFVQFVGHSKVWGYGAAFDNSFMSFHAKKLGLKWNYRNDMCFRTLKSLFDTKLELINKPHFGGVNLPENFVSIGHNALYDAILQAQQALQIFKYINEHI